MGCYASNQRSTAALQLRYGRREPGGTTGTGWKAERLSEGLYSPHMARAASGSRAPCSQAVRVLWGSGKNILHAVEILVIVKIHEIVFFVNTVC